MRGRLPDCCSSGRKGLRHQGLIRLGCARPKQPVAVDAGGVKPDSVLVGGKKEMGTKLFTSISQVPEAMGQPLLLEDAKELMKQIEKRDLQCAFWVVSAINKLFGTTEGCQ